MCGICGKGINTYLCKKCEMKLKLDICFNKVGVISLLLKLNSLLSFLITKLLFLSSR